MTFDPFADFAERGYLRNHFGEKDHDIIRRAEHSAFVSGIEEAFSNLSQRPFLSYADVLGTHKALFKDIYPWAGQDRFQTTPDIAVSKGDILFAHPEAAQQAVEYALRLGHDKTFMSQHPGDVMGYLAYGHPFLDGNGRTIMVVHSELAQRAGISIDWAETDKMQYLSALTNELNNPNKGILDSYLRPFLRPAVGVDQLASHVAKTKGLDGGADSEGDDNKILGKVTDPALQARYKEQERQRTTDSNPMYQTYREQAAAQLEPEPTATQQEHKQTIKR